jgi:hypothetical protein
MKLSIDEPAGDHGLLNDAHARQGPAGCHEVCKTDATESDGAQRGAFGVFVRKYAHFRRSRDSGADAQDPTSAWPRYPYRDINVDISADRSLGFF